MDLAGAHLEGADLWEVHLGRANLERAHLEGASLRFAHLEGANLARAYLEGANLEATHFDKDTDFRNAVVQDATVRSSDVSMVNLDQAQLNGMFGDGTMTANKLPEGISRPKHWPKIALRSEIVDGKVVDRFAQERDKWAADPKNYVPPTE